MSPPVACLASWYPACIGDPASIRDMASIWDLACTWSFTLFCEQSQSINESINQPDNHSIDTSTAGMLTRPEYGDNEKENSETVMFNM